MCGADLSDLCALGAPSDGSRVWLLAVASAAVVGLSGVLPLLLLPFETGLQLQQRDGEKRLRLLLSFAVGGLIGDVFLHLLPEALRNTHNERDKLMVALWVLAGGLFFTLLETVFSTTADIGRQPERYDNHVTTPTTNDHTTIAAQIYEHHAHIQNGVNDLQLRQRFEKSVRAAVPNGSVQVAGECAGKGTHTKCSDPTRKSACGYLNLLANSVDNFTHGLAIGGSFLASTRIGLLTTFAILIHEIPHEVGDFAILIKSGFGRWEAARAQLATASLGVLGTVCALLAEDKEQLGVYTAWILPFTAGGFMQIALLGVMPEVARERELLQCVKQSVCLLAGVGVMLMVTLMTHHHHHHH